jgi:pimeloyl-ACP methyl ester carboxylesterase
MAVTSSFVVTARDVEDGGRFGTEPGPLRFLRVKAGADDYSSKDAATPGRWRAALIRAADGIGDEITGKTGNVLIFIHGYNNDRKDVLWRTRMLQRTLGYAGWNGVVVAFDWPSDNSTLGYLEDRHDASQIADTLVTELLPLLVPVERRTVNGVVMDPDPDCKIDVHMIGHSTGAFVAIEAFARAQRLGPLFKSEWRLGQLAFIAGDVAASCLAKDDDWARPMLERIVRLTNYSNGHDAVLGASNAKRLGLSPRAGRTGAGMPIHPKVVNVDCTKYFETIDPDQATFNGTFCHSWHVGDSAFAMDLALTLEAGSDRWVLPTRNGEQGSLQLQAAQKLPFADLWKMDKSVA